jgi:hypothetical protein
MNRVLLALLLTGAVLLPAACVRTVELDRVEVTEDFRRHSPARSATDLPPAFDVVMPARTPGTCPPRLRDPGLGVMLDLFRSLTVPVTADGEGRYESVGDYRITPPGHYGSTSAMEGLRVECAVLRPLGLVRLDGAGGG